MSSVKEYRTKCPFCAVQDDVILKKDSIEAAVFGKDSLFKLYYDKRSRRGLCPRGNFTLEILNSPSRLRQAELFGKTCSVDEAIEGSILEIKRMKEKKNNIAILISGNHSLEEAFLAKKLSEVLNTELLGLFPFEDEALLSIKNEFSFDELGEADLVMTVGDVFSLSPTLSKPILDARNKKRGNRLISLDIINNRVSPFAEHFPVKPGYMAYFLSLFFNYLKGKSKVQLNESEVGISEEKMQLIGEALKKSEKGYILFSNIYGHFKSPYRIVKYLDEIAEITENRFAVIPVGQNSLGVGRVIGSFNNKEIIEALKGGELECLFVFGGDPFEFIPDFQNIFEYLNFVLSTYFFKEKNPTECVIPSTFSFEKEGSIVSLEEKLVNLGEAIPPVGDSISDGGFISRLLYKLTKEKVKAPISSCKPIPFLEEKEEKIPDFSTSRNFPFIVIGVGLPYHHGSGEITRMMKWNQEKEKPYVFLNPDKAKELSLEKEVTIETANGSSVFEIEDYNKLPFGIPRELIVVPVHYPPSRKLFIANPDEDGIISPGAEKARIVK
jgi:anaerobic selenocysteine-containing dehydrogenase